MFTSLIEENFLSETGNDNFFGSFKDNGEFNPSSIDEHFPLFLQEESQQDMQNKDFYFKDMDLNEENEENDDFRQIYLNRNDEDGDEKEINPKEKKQVSSTGPTSDKKSEIKIKKVADKFNVQNQSLPNYWRFDMVKKHFKTKISEYGTNFINELIQKSDLPSELKKTIHKPNSPKFTANVKVSDNYRFLNDTIRTIFTIGKETEDLQKQNDEIINEIYKHFGRIGYDKLSENLRNIKNFFEMNCKVLIKNFYNSIEFKAFKEDDKTKFFDEGTIKQEGFSLLENYGLINLFSMLKKKRRRD